MAEKLEDLNLPNAVVLRIIRSAMGDNTMIGRDARLALGRAASVFVLYLTSAATNAARRSNRKTLTGNDVLDALKELEFDEFIPGLLRELDIFRKSKLEQRSKKAINGASANQPDDDDEEDDSMQVDNGVEDDETEVVSDIDDDNDAEDEGNDSELSSDNDS